MAKKSKSTKSTKKSAPAVQPRIRHDEARRTLDEQFQLTRNDLRSARAEVKSARENLALWRDAFTAARTAFRQVRADRDRFEPAPRTPLSPAEKIARKIARLQARLQEIAPAPTVEHLDEGPAPTAQE